MLLETLAKQSSLSLFEVSSDTMEKIRVAWPVLFLMFTGMGLRAQD
jgi:hypothetical protein